MALPRVSGRTGSVVRLDVSFFQGGVLADPFAIRRIDIYRGSTSPENLVATIPVPDPASTDYPYPIVRSGAGEYYVDFEIPDDFVPDGYFDVWSFIPEEPDTAFDVDDEEFWMSKCNRFWVYENSWYVDDGLETLRFDFDPLDIRFRQPEKRILEVGLMPLPLYDYNYNLIVPQIPNMQATISIQTMNCELIIDAAAMTIGLRQGTYRSNPFVFKYLLDTSTFLIGTYKYRITVTLANGETRVSRDFNFEIL